MNPREKSADVMMRNPPASNTRAVRDEDRLANSQCAVKPKNQKVVERVCKSVRKDQVEDGKDGDCNRNA